jgi:hypothetical protein
MGYFLAILLFLSGIVLWLAYKGKSWRVMLVGAIILLPYAWFISWYPPYPWALYIPVIMLILAAILFVRRNKSH